jgi:hypothetical protein
MDIKDKDDKEKQFLNRAKIVSIIAGSVIGVIGLIILVYFIYKMYKHDSGPEYAQWEYQDLPYP